MDNRPQAQSAWERRMESLLGPAFGRFRVLDDEQARYWSARREELFRKGQRLGLKSHEGNCAHLYTGELSPGCESCTEGAWSCLCVNGRCNRRCFFCPQDLRNPVAKTRPTFEAHFEQAFEQPEDYIDFLQQFSYRGVSVSGGEPFLTFDRTLELVRRTREAFGREMYIWVYTNGSLYTRERGEQLVEAGLDELRFNISSGDYDLTSVGEAVKTVPAVTVEIPAIPEDKEVVIEVLPRLEELGVRFLNLHQLYATKTNGEKFADRGYTLIRDSSVVPPVLESEICALEIMCRALENGIRLPINYCSNAYKTRFQNRGKRRRAVDVLARSGITPETGFPTASAVFRRLVIQGSGPENRALMNRFRRAGVDASRVVLSDDESAIYLHPDLIDHPAIGKRHVVVEYFRYVFEKCGCTCTHEGRPIEDEDKEDTRSVHRVGPIGQLELHNEVARIGFRKLVLEGWSLPKTLQALTARSDAARQRQQMIEQFLQTVHEYALGLEYLDPRFAPYA